MLLAGAAIPVSAYGQCVTDRFTVDACLGGVRLTAPPGLTFDQSFLGGSLGPGAVFNRASTGTYYDSAGVLRSAAIDAPRFDYDPVTLQLKGLLLEDTSTNLVLNSAVLVTQSVTTTATAYTLSFQGTGTVTKSGTATGALAGTGAAQRVSQTFTPTAGTLTLTVTGSVTSAQVEALPYASSYIPTTTVAVTRARDALSYPVASVTGFSATQGSLAHEYYVEGCVPNFTAPIQFVGASVNNDFISVDQLTTSGATGSTPVVSGVLIKAAAVTQGSANFTGGIATPGGVVHRGAAAWALSGTVICAHDGAGQSTITGTNTSLPVIANLTIAGQMNAQGNVVSQWARRTRYWPRQLAQAELISVTA